MLSRRSLLGAMASAYPLSLSAKMSGGPRIKTPKMTIPPRLKQGDLVAIVSPAGAADDDATIAAAAANLETLGLKVKVMPNANKRWGYLADTDAERANDINEAIRDKEIKGIITLRGGYGTMRLLPLVDYDAFKHNPKVVMGYSDITGLLNAITRKTGVVTYHGQIAESHFDGFEGEWMRKAIFETDAIGRFGVPTELTGRAVNPQPAVIQSGKAKGRLIGGNLSLIAPCAGTEYGPDFKDAILFLEDIGEAAYRVDRMLTGLWLGGHLQQLNGIFIGDFRPAKGVAEDIDTPLVPEGTFTMAQVFSNLKQWTKAPICTGLYTGHIRDKLTLPIGAMVELDADNQTLTMLRK